MSMSKLKAVLAVPPLFFVAVATSSVAAVVNTLSHLTLRRFSSSLHRRLCLRFTYAFFLISNFLLERWAAIKFRTYGDPVPTEKSVLVVINHYSNVDWLLGLSHLSRLGYPAPGNAKCVVKAALGRVPLFGTILRTAEFAFLTRDWTKDREHFLETLAHLRTFPAEATPFLFVLYPEGTRLTKDKLPRSQEYAASRGRPAPKHVLFPRAKAFTSIMSSLRSQLAGVVDATYIFDGAKPSMLSTLAGTADTTIHAHSKFYPMENIPEDEAAMEEWLIDRWYEKDALIANFERDPTSIGPDNPNLFPLPNPSLTPFYALILVFTVSAAGTIYFFSLIQNGLHLLAAIVIAAVAAVAAFTTRAARPTKKGTR